MIICLPSVKKELTKKSESLVVVIMSSRTRKEKEGWEKFKEKKAKSRDCIKL